MGADTQAQPMQHTLRRRVARAFPYLLLALVVVAVILLVMRILSETKILAAEKSAALRESVPPVNVVALELRATTIEDRLQLPGTLKPWTTLKIAAEIPGKVVRMHVREGDTVAAGDLLAQLDDREHRNQHRSAQAAHETARTTVKRLEQLLAKNATTQARLDDARSQLSAARAAMDNAALSVERCAIRAAIAGTINRLPVEIGHFLNKGDPVAELLQIDRLKVSVGIPESDVDAVRRLNRFEVTIDALAGRRFEARRHYLSKTTDPAARLYDLELALDNPRGEILPDMFARVDIVKKRVTDGIAVPLYAVISRQDGHVVYVVEDGAARARSVVLGTLDGWQCEVREGLAAGERVIVVGQRNVNDGQAVKVVRQVTDPAEITR